MPLKVAQILFFPPRRRSSRSAKLTFTTCAKKTQGKLQVMILMIHQGALLQILQSLTQLPSYRFFSIKLFDYRLGISSVP